MQFHEMYMDKIHNHEVAGSIPAPATVREEREGQKQLRSSCVAAFLYDGKDEE